MSANQLDKKSEAWSALFSEPMSELVRRYTSSVDFDRRLWRADIAGSLAHASMLAGFSSFARLYSRSAPAQSQSMNSTPPKAACASARFGSAATALCAGIRIVSRG